MEKEPVEIQLEGSRLTEVRKIARQIESDVLMHAEQILHELYGAESKGHSVKSIRVYPNNMKTAILNASGKVVGVWVDPPGLCRKPRRGEKFD